MLRALCLLVLLSSPLLAWAAPPLVPITLAWDYDVEEVVDGFRLERKVGQAGTYTPLPLTIAGTARTATDVTAVRGQVQCYQLLAVVDVYVSLPSNEVCIAVVGAPLTLRIQ